MNFVPEYKLDDNSMLVSTQKKEILMLHINEADLGISLRKIKDSAVINEIRLPHRHDHYSCFFVEKGTFRNSIDFTEVTVKPNTLLISYPGQVHLLHSISKCSGWMLLFDDKLIDDNVRTLFEESLAEIALLELSEKDNWQILSTLNLMHSFYREQKGKAFFRQLLRSTLDVFIYQAASMYKSAENIRESGHSLRNVEITKKFKKLLREHYKTVKKPSAYAGMLNLSAVYLNECVKNVTGLPVSYHIQYEIIKEAQRLLFYSGNSIKEIGFSLGYEDIQYFHRLFRKMTGLTPLQFRNQILSSGKSDGIV